MWQLRSGTLHAARTLIAAAALLVCGMPAAAQGRGMGAGMGMMGGTHDSATAAQMRVIHELVMNNDRITRTVTNLPNGIRTVTESDDPRLAALIKDHVATMDQRVRAGDDPLLPMESPALHSIFAMRDRIVTTIDTTTRGIVIVQTSSDSAAVAALQQHAADVTDLVNRGMAAMRDAMMKNAPAMGGGRRGPP
jgi:hypothetical protein